MDRQLQRTVLSHWLWQVFHRWLSLSRWKKTLTVGGICLLSLVGVLSFFLWTGVASALQARNHFDDVEVQLSQLSPVDMIDAVLYQSLAGQFRKAEESAMRAPSRLRFLGLFTGLPGVGGRIKDSVTQLELAQEGGIEGSRDWWMQVRGDLGHNIYCCCASSA